MNGYITTMKYLCLAAALFATMVPSPVMGLDSFSTATASMAEKDTKRGSVRRAASEESEPTDTPTHEPTSEPTHQDKEHVRPTCTLIVPPFSTEQCPAGSDEKQAPQLPLCAGIRGNGARLWAHFPALARTVESFGIVSGVAGGSSGTITSFLLESINSNPLVLQCDEETCCDEFEQRARISFLLKAMEQVPSATLISPVEYLVIVFSEIEKQDILPRLKSDDPEIQNAAMADLFSLFAKKDIAPLVNPDFIELLKVSPNPIFHAIDILTASTQGLSPGDDKLVFVRPYIFNFAALADIFDQVASFYAGLQPVDLGTFNIMLAECAVRSVEKDWDDIKTFETSIEGTCGDLFTSIFQQFLVTRGNSDPTRVDDFLGSTTKALITTAVLRDEAVTTWQQAVEDYEAINLPISLDVDFKDVRFGYYGDETSLNRVIENIPALFDDSKSEKFASLGPATWRDVLQQSPAEPTLSRGVPILDNTLVSVAGWNDPVPAQVLTSMGCDRVVLINSPDGQGQFGLEVATLLGASSRDLHNLFSLDDPDSSFVVALREADASYCADWNGPSQLDISGLADEGYAAPLLSDDECVLSLDVGAVNNDIRGCTP